jgi:hypothetical protein
MQASMSDEPRIPGLLPYREDGYKSDDPEPWERPWNGERAPHTGVNLMGSGYLFNPRPQPVKQIPGYKPSVQDVAEALYLVEYEQRRYDLASRALRKIYTARAELFLDTLAAILDERESS